MAGVGPSKGASMARGPKIPQNHDSHCLRLLHHRPDRPPDLRGDHLIEIGPE
jgi:hypothetical protein